MGAHMERGSSPEKRVANAGAAVAHGQGFGGEEPQRWRKLAAPLAGMVVAMFTSIAGVGGVVAKIRTEAVPNLFIGLIGAGSLLFLLMIPIINNRRARGIKEKTRKIMVEEKKVWSLSAEEVCADLRVSGRVGLSHAEAEVRRAQYGANEAVVRTEPGYFSFFVKEIYEPTQLLLLGVGILYLMLGSLEEAITAFLVIILMASAEVGTEWRAKQALKSLQHSNPSAATVKREGKWLKLDAESLVPGDIIMLKVGMEVPADLRLIHSYFLMLDESKLTGEVTPVLKTPSQPLCEGTSVLERTNVALQGSLVTQGRGIGVVYQTGTSTYLGQIVNLTSQGKSRKTNLQKMMKEVSYRLTILALIMSFLGALLGVWRGARWQDVILSGLSLAFATIPEELPILIVAVLAVGAQALSRRYMYVKKLRAAENLGFVDTILTDKTGTLTENHLLWHSAHLGTEQYKIRSRALSFRRSSDSVGLERILEAWLFMAGIGDDLEDNTLLPPQQPLDAAVSFDFGDNAKLTDTTALRVAANEDNEPGSSPHYTGADMFDQAVLFALGSTACFLGGSPGYGLLISNPNVKDHLEKVYKTKLHAKLLAETSFDPTFKFSSRTFQIHSGSVEHSGITEVHVMYVKGAPELLLSHCSHFVENGNVVPIGNVRGYIEEQVVKAASQGHRLIGYAYLDLKTKSKNLLNNQVEASRPLSMLEGGTFLGFFSFLDPVREESFRSVSECQEAGMRVIMVTGDLAETAVAVAQQVGIISASQNGDPSDMTVSCTDIQFQNLQKDELQDIVLKKRIFARATPADKLVILEALQGCGKCVMATGDGVNDAPILAQADVGVAMGKGTDVAREAAAIVLMDDNFAMIPVSLAEGRRLLDNLRKALAFYLGAKAGLVLLFIFGTLWHRGPLSAIQMIMLELFMDLGASSSFVMEPADNDIMKREPRHSSKSFFDSELLGAILVSATSMSMTVLTSFMFAVYDDSKTAQTSAFFTWFLVQVLMAFNLRTFRQPVIFKGLLSNQGMFIWFLLTILVSVVICTSHFVRSNLGLVALSRKHWLFIISISIAGTCWIEFAKLLVFVSQNRKVTFQFCWPSKEVPAGQSLLVIEEQIPLTKVAEVV